MKTIFLDVVAHPLTESELAFLDVRHTLPFVFAILLTLVVIVLAVIFIVKNMGQDVYGGISDIGNQNRNGHYYDEKKDR